MSVSAESQTSPQRSEDTTDSTEGKKSNHNFCFNIRISILQITQKVVPKR